jgi:hypothetical protein
MAAGSLSSAMREQLEQVAGELDEAMVAVAARAGTAWHPWQHIEWLRLQADLLDRLGAAFGGPGSCRAELLRDRAERMADRINGMPYASGGFPSPPSAANDIPSPASPGTPQPPGTPPHATGTPHPPGTARTTGAGFPSRQVGPPDQRVRLRAVARHGHLLHPEPPPQQ